MKDFLILLREADGRTDPHPEEDIKRHQLNWQEWISKMKAEQRLVEGKSLTVQGKVLHNPTHIPLDGPYRYGLEMVGGFLRMRALDLEEATEVMRSCPVFEFGGIAEVRELQ